MVEIRIGENKIFKVSKNLFLLNPGDWDEDWVEVIASACGIEFLTANHWKIIYYLRRFYDDNLPMPCGFNIRQEFGLSRKDFQALFPRGIKTARRLAGLPEFDNF